MTQTSHRGFTLVEVLVVIAIIGVLVALLLPAVIAARESARRVECANNLRQLAIACTSHEAQQKYFPSGGWNFQFVGDSSLGFGRNQPGSWLFNVLPFTDYANIWLMGSNVTGEERKKQIALQNQIPIPIFNCPSRRSPQTYLFDGNPAGLNRSQGFINSGHLLRNIRGDYAANSGDFGYSYSPHPDAHVGMPPGLVPGTDYMPNWNWSLCMAGRTGVIYVTSEVTSRMISDGLSKTLLIGEKNLHVDHYSDGLLAGDNNSAYSGFNYDNQRVINEANLPIPDTDGRSKQTGYADVGADSPGCQFPTTHCQSFGSTHLGIWQAAFCDGSVVPISYSLDINIGKKLANRRDGQYVERP